MSAQPESEDLHRLVDRLTPAQVRVLRAVAEEFVHVSREPDSSGGDADRIRRLSFVGLGRGGPDLAERSEEILRAELGDPAE